MSLRLGVKVPRACAAGRSRSIVRMPSCDEPGPFPESRLTSVGGPDITLNVSRRLHTIATAVVLAASLGMHWAVLQTVAWAGMLAEFSKDAPLVEAIGKTFSGDNPCRLCIEVNKGRSAEQTPEGVLKVQKLDLLCALPEPFIVEGALPSVGSAMAPLRTYLSPPPTPPPPRAA